MGSFHVEAAKRLQAGETEDYYKGDLAEQVRRLQVSGVCDVKEKKNCQHNLAGIPLYNDWRELLSQQRPHLAIIATPTRTHFELGKQALGADVHCLIEKPLTTDMPECEELFSTASLHGCRLLAGHVERYNPVTIKLHSFLSGGSLKVDNYRFDRIQKLPERIPDDIVVDKLIHDLDISLYLFGPAADIQLVSCKRSRGRIVETEVELTHRQGTTGRLFVSWLTDSDQKQRQVRMQTVDGKNITGDFVDKELEINGEPTPCGVEGWIQPVNNQIKDQLTDFFAYCMEPRPDIPPPLLSPEEIKEAIRIIDKVRHLTASYG